jgi:hypothetical protein
MGWADGHIARLAQGETVQFRPRGHSMTGKVNDGQLCTVTPLVGDHELVVGDIVLCRVKGSQYLHLIKATTSRSSRSAPRSIASHGAATLSDGAATLATGRRSRRCASTQNTDSTPDTQAATILTLTAMRW